MKITHIVNGKIDLTEFENGECIIRYDWKPNVNLFVNSAGDVHLSGRHGTFQSKLKPSGQPAKMKEKDFKELAEKVWQEFMEFGKAFGKWLETQGKPDSAKHWWIIEVADYGSFNFFGTEEKAEERRAHKAKWEHAVATKRRGREIKKDTFGDW